MKDFKIQNCELKNRNKMMDLDLKNQNGGLKNRTKMANLDF